MTPPRASVDDLPDVTDPTIRAMVLRNHEPEETWTYGGQVYVHCATCWKDWPCPSRIAAWEAEKQAFREAVRRVDREKPKRWRWWF
jgi:hypothetical protein